MKMSHNMLGPFFMSLVYRHILGMHKPRLYYCLFYCYRLWVVFESANLFFFFFFKRLAATCTMTVRTACPVPHNLTNLRQYKVVETILLVYLPKSYWLPEVSIYGSRYWSRNLIILTIVVSVRLLPKQEIRHMHQQIIFFISGAGNTGEHFNQVLL